MNEARIPIEEVHSGSRRGLARVAVLLALPWLCALPASGQPTGELSAVELTVPVQQRLVRLQELWLGWLEAYHQDDRDRMQRVLNELLTGTQKLGMSRLPDLALGAAASAMRSAAAGDSESADAALRAARILDPGRPEIEFAAARVAVHQGRWGAAAAHALEGYLEIGSTPGMRSIWWSNFGLWLVAVLLAAGGVFVAIGGLATGARLLEELGEVLDGFLPRSVGALLSVFVLFCPLLLPRGLVWLLLFWSVLLWVYGSRSQRLVLAGLWLLMAVAPGIVRVQRARVALELAPPVRAMENLAVGRLDGALLNDLGQLQTLLPDSAAATQLLADLHRRLGQWEHARALYRAVAEEEPTNVAVLIDLGAYYFESGDLVNARDRFRRATAVDPRSAAAFFNLSKAYSASYLFEDAEDALLQARALDEAAVSRWIREMGPEQVVATNGGVARIPEIRAQLATLWRSALASPRSGLAVLGGAVAARLALACLLGGLTLQFFRSRWSGRWREAAPLRPWHAVVPGLAAARGGRGWRAYGAWLFPTAFLSLPLAGRLGCELPWGIDPGSEFVWALAATGLAVYLARHLWRAADPLGWSSP